MSLVAIKSIAARAIAFAGTLTLSLALVGGLPNVKERRQRYFADASLNGNVSRMQLLHLVGANVDAGEFGQNPLLLAAGEGRLAAVRYLLNEGADINAHSNDGNTALMEAAFYGHAAVVKELLVRGANTNAISSDGTALDIALSRKDPALIELLKHYGAKSGRDSR